MLINIHLKKSNYSKIEELMKTILLLSAQTYVTKLK